MRTGFEPHRFSTRGAPEAARIPLWQEQFGRGMLRVNIAPLANEAFQADATLRALPGLRSVTCATTVAVCYDRTRDLLADGDDSIGIVINLGPRAEVRHLGEEIVLDRGDAIPMTTSAAALLSATQHLGLLFPRAVLASRVSHLGAGPLRKIRRGTEPLRLLTSYFRTVRDEAVLDSPALRDSVIGHLYDLAALVLEGRQNENTLSAVAAARLATVLEMMRQRFCEPDLGAAEVARSLNISPRYLHRLIETTGKSFSMHVNELRLAHALGLLSADAAGRRPIAEIALASGFSDISYFNRLFRARFGDTPRAFRGASAEGC